jgi:hypothetical protein
VKGTGWTCAITHVGVGWMLIVERSCHREGSAKGISCCEVSRRERFSGGGHILTVAVSRIESQERKSCCECMSLLQILASENLVVSGDKFWRAKIL